MNKFKKPLALVLSGIMMTSALPMTALATPSVGSTTNDPSVGQDTIQGQYTEYTEVKESTETEVYLTVEDSDLIVSLPTTVILDGTPNDSGQYIGKYSVGVKGDMSGDKVVTVEPDTSVVSLRQDGKVNNDATISQTQTDFDTDDFRDKTVTDGTITATGLTAGSWNSEFNFNVSVSKNGIPAGYTTLYEYDLSATEADDVKAYYVVPTKNTTPIDVPSQQSEESSNSYSLKTKTLNTSATDNKVIEYNGVRYELSDEDTLVISGKGNMMENLTTKMYDYQDVMNAVETKFDIKCTNKNPITNPELDGDKVLYFFDNQAYPIAYYVRETDGLFENKRMPSGITDYIDSIINNYNIKTPNTVIVKDGVTNIGVNAFKNCTTLKNIELANSITSIEKDAFSGCKNLTEIILPNKLNEIGSGAFSGCLNLTSVTICSELKKIGLTAFYYCQNLTDITIPNSVTSIGYYAFSSVPNIYYNGTASGSPWGAKSVNGYVDGCLVYNNSTKTQLLSCALNAKDIIIPSSVTSIRKIAFYECTNLTSVTIPDSVTSVGDSAFYNLASGSTIYCQSQTVANLLTTSIYNTSKTTVVVDASKFE